MTSKLQPLTSTQEEFTSLTSTTICPTKPEDTLKDDEEVKSITTPPLESYDSFQTFPADTSEGWSDFERVNVHFIGNNGAWQQRVTEVKIRQKPFAQGFKNEFFLVTKERQMMVAKQSGFAANTFEHQQKEVYAQCYLAEAASSFNKDLFEAKLEQHYLAVLPAFVYEFIARPAQEKFFYVVPYMDGTHEQYNCNSGSITSAAEGPNAFSHWTYQHSNPSVMILNVQGVGGILTDPQVCTASPNAMFNAYGNGGQRSMETFFMHHVCNQVCKKLGLTEESNHGATELAPPAPPVEFFCYCCWKRWSPNIQAMLQSETSTDDLLHSWCDSCRAVEKEVVCATCNTQFKYCPFRFYQARREEPSVCLSCVNGTTSNKNPVV